MSVKKNHQPFFCQGSKEQLSISGQAPTEADGGIWQTLLANKLPFEWYAYFHILLSVKHHDKKLRCKQRMPNSSLMYFSAICFD